MAARVGCGRVAVSEERVHDADNAGSEFDNGAGIANSREVLKRLAAGEIDFEDMTVVSSSSPSSGETRQETSGKL